MIIRRGEATFLADPAAAPVALPGMRITLTRASINMGDDGDAPHYADLDVPDDASLDTVLRAVDAMRYHHLYAGGWTTWTVYFGWPRGESSRSLAVLNHHRVAYLEDPDSGFTQLAGGGSVGLHLEHEGGRSLETLRDRLLNGRRATAVRSFEPVGEPAGE